MYAVIIDGGRLGDFWAFEETVRLVSEAARKSLRWDVRRRTAGRGDRPLTESEGSALVSAVTEELT